MHDDAYAYGSWGIAITMIAISLFFIVRFIPMRTRLGRRSGGALIAFVVALFAEMYGFPLTIYFLRHFIGINIPLDHVSGHLLGDIISWLGLGNGWAIVMIVSNALIILGIWLVSAGWEAMHESQGALVTDGEFRYVRHPQYTGLFVITLGFMIQWPALATLILWPFVFGWMCAWPNMRRMTSWRVIGRPGGSTWNAYRVHPAPVPLQPWTYAFPCNLSRTIGASNARISHTQ